MILGALTAVSALAERPAPRTILLDGERLAAARDAIRRHGPAVMPAWAALHADADRALGADRLSVVDKDVTPPSGDKHDYMSQAPYFWPDPSKPNGLPYIRRDGERNPEINHIGDHRALDGLADSTETLALAAYFSGDARYGTKAASLLRAWFIDPATRMNPNLEYAQFVPGASVGRNFGIIEARGLMRVADAVALLEGTPQWSSAADRAVKEWYASFLEWMQTGSNGRKESAAKNNHGTYYDLQVATYALFLNKSDLARQVIETAKEKRIATQIEPDGREPLELARTKAWSYSVGNLNGLTQLAQVGEHVGVDLWHYQSGDGRSIRRAALYLARFALDAGAVWPYRQLGGFNGAALYPVLRRAASHYDDEEFTKVAAKVPSRADTDRSILY